MLVQVVFLVSVLVGIIFFLVGPPSDVAQGPLLELLLEYSPSEVVSLVGGGGGITCLIFKLLAVGPLFACTLMLQVGS